MITLRFDGLFRGVPGVGNGPAQAGFMSYGWLIFRNATVIARGHGVSARAKDATSNVAEYLALIEGLEALIDLGVRGEAVMVCGDARCIIDQMRGVSNVNSERMRPLYHRASHLAGQLPPLQWSWTPRRHNKEADMLTRRAMRQLRQDAAGFAAAVRAIDPRTGAKANNKFLNLMDLRVYLSGA